MVDIGKTICLTDMDHIGQVKEEKAEKEIERLFNQSGETYRKDYSQFLSDDSYDDNDNLLPPAELREGNCWIVKVGA